MERKERNMVALLELNHLRLVFAVYFNTYGLFITFQTVHVLKQPFLKNKSSQKFEHKNYGVSAEQDRSDQQRSTCL